MQMRSNPDFSSHCRLCFSSPPCKHVLNPSAHQWCLKESDVLKKKKKKLISNCAVEWDLARGGVVFVPRPLPPPQHVCGELAGLTEGFLQDFTEKKIFLSHLQPLRSSPVASTNRNAANLAALKCRLYAFLASQTVIKRRCIMREQKGNGCGGWASSNNVGLLFVPNRRRYTTRRLDTPLSLAKPEVFAPQKVQVKKK